MKVVSTVFLFLGAVFALLLIAAGILGYLVTGPAPRQGDTASIPVSQEAAQRFDQKIEALEQEIDEASAMGERREVVLFLTEEEITSKLAELADANELPVDVDYVEVHLEDDKVYGFAIVDLGIDMQVSVEAEIGVEGGMPDTGIESLNIGRLPIPKTLIAQVMRALIRQMEGRWEDLNIDLEDVAIQNGAIRITAVTR